MPLRVSELVEAFGAGRLLAGSDFPFGAADLGKELGSPAKAVNKDSYFAAANLPLAWNLPLSKDDFDLLTRGTAEKLYGKFGR